MFSFPGLADLHFGWPELQRCFKTVLEPPTQSSQKVTWPPFQRSNLLCLKLSFTSRMCSAIPIWSRAHVCPPQAWTVLLELAWERLHTGNPPPPRTLELSTNMVACLRLVVQSAVGSLFCSPLMQHGELRLNSSGRAARALHAMAAHPSPSALSADNLSTRGNQKS